MFGVGLLVGVLIGIFLGILFCSISVRARIADLEDTVVFLRHQLSKANKKLAYREGTE
jgi:Na+/H+ antiporter NhaA